MNELGSWITQQHIQTLHQYDVGSHPALYITKRLLSTRSRKWKSLPVAFPCSGVLSGYFDFSTTKTGRHDIAEILLKVVLKHQISINQNVFIVFEYSI